MLQPDLFDLLSHNPLEQENAPDLDLSLDMIQILKQLERDSPYNRDRIVDRMNLCLINSDVKISVAQMNKWLAPSQPHEFPGWMYPAFCWAVQSMAPFNVLMRPLHHKAADARDSMISQATTQKILAAQQKRDAEKMEKAATQFILGKFK